MNTSFVLLAQYDGRSVIPIEIVCRDYFTHLNATGFAGKITRGEIALPLVRMDAGQKAARGESTSTTSPPGLTRAGQRRSRNSNR